MRRMVITETDLGAVKHYVVETSAGVRSSGISLEDTLAKLALGEPPVIPDELHGFARIFRAIRPTKGSSQIHEGIQS